MNGDTSINISMLNMRLPYCDEYVQGYAYITTYTSGSLYPIINAFKRIMSENVSEFTHHLKKMQLKQHVRHKDVIYINE